jgi:small subunit ribosomal protein S6e
LWVINLVKTAAKPLYTPPNSVYFNTKAEAPVKQGLFIKGVWPREEHKMSEFKLVISDPKTGKSVQKEAKDEVCRKLFGLKIGDALKGEILDLAGYEFVITGGSDYAGFPMRSDVSGQGRKKITAVKGVGILNKLRLPNPKKKGWRTMQGMRLKKTVAGNTIHAKTAQVNLKITKAGKETLFVEKPAEEPKKE